MFNYKSTSYEKLEKPKQEKKFKQNSYEEIRKLVEDNDTEVVNNIKNKKNNKSENNIKFNFKLFD